MLECSIVKTCSRDDGVLLRASKKAAGDERSIAIVTIAQSKHRMLACAKRPESEYNTMKKEKEACRRQARRRRETTSEVLTG